MAAEAFCRFCLVTGINMETVNVEDIECFSDLTESDSPLLACYECRAMIRTLNIFLTKFVTSQAVMRYIQKSQCEIKEEDIKKIDRKSLKLISSLKCCEKSLVISYDTMPEGSMAVQNNGQLLDHTETDNFDTKVLRKCRNSRKGKVKDNIIELRENVDNTDTISLDGVLEDRSNCLNREEKDTTEEKKLRKKRASKQKVSNEDQVVSDKKGPRFKRPDIAKIRLDEFFDITDMTLSQQIEEFSKRKDSPNYKNSPYKCELCYRGYKHKNTYDNHVNTSHNPELGWWMCKVCKKYRKTRRSIYQHRESHTQLYKCKICEYVTIPRTAAVNHAYWHKGAIYECRICSQVFEHPQSRLGHERTKHPSESSCDICGLPFVSAIGVVTHKRMAHFGYEMSKDPPDPKLYCKACNIQFVSLVAWKKHLETSAKHKPLSENTGFICRHCGEACLDAAELNAHQRLKHVSARDANPPLRGGRGYPRLVPPPVPGEHPEVRAHNVARARAEARARSYRLPTVTHYPQQCAHCDEVLLNPQNHWRHHIGRHFGKPYKKANFVCELCGKGFMYESNLKTHTELKHTGVGRRYQCDYCNAKAPTKLGLYYHMQRHLKPSHPCSVCGKVLASVLSLKAHFRNHHGGSRPFKCPHCDKTFIRGSILKTHVNEVHLRLVKKRIRDKTKKRINIGSIGI